MKDVYCVMRKMFMCDIIMTILINTGSDVDNGKPLAFANYRFSRSI